MHITKKTIHFLFQLFFLLNGLCRMSRDLFLLGQQSFSLAGKPKFTQLLPQLQHYLSLHPQHWRDHKSESIRLSGHIVVHSQCSTAAGQVSEIISEQETLGIPLLLILQLIIVVGIWVHFAHFQAAPHILNGKNSSHSRKLETSLHWEVFEAAVWIMQWGVCCVVVPADLML